MTVYEQVMISLEKMANGEYATRGLCGDEREKIFDAIDIVAELHMEWRQERERRGLSV